MPIPVSLPGGQKLPGKTYQCAAALLDGRSDIVRFENSYARTV